MVLLLAASVALAQDCPKEGLQMIQEGTAALWDAYARVNITAFDAASAVIKQGIGCVRAPLDPHDITELHRTMAVIAFAAGQETPSKKSWIAARTLDPTWDLPIDLYPPNHPVRLIFEAAVPQPQKEEEQSLEDDDGVHWLVDGLPGTTVPLDRAFVLQALDDQHQVIYTGYICSIVDLPSLRVSPPQGLHTAIVRFGANATAGVLASTQTGESGFGDEHPTSAAGGLELRARLQPIRPVGADFSAEGIGVVDGLSGAWASPTVRAALTLGWDARTDERRIRGVLRPGIGWERIRAWSGDPSSPSPVDLSAPTFFVGAGFEYATERLAVDASLDPTFLLTGAPWQLSAEGQVTSAVTDVVGLEGGLRVAPSLGAYQVLDATTGGSVATRRDTAVEAFFGLCIYR